MVSSCADVRAGDVQLLIKRGLPSSAGATCYNPIGTYLVGSYLTVPPRSVPPRPVPTRSVPTRYIPAQSVFTRSAPNRPFPPGSVGFSPAGSYLVSPFLLVASFAKIARQYLNSNSIIVGRLNSASQIYYSKAAWLYPRRWGPEQPTPP